MATSLSEGAVEKKRIAALQRTLLFGSLPEKELVDIAERATELRFRQGEMLFFSGEEAKGLFVVVSGKIRVFEQTSEGREQVMHTDIAGCVIADVPVFDDGPYPASAVSELDAEVLFIEKSLMHQFCIRYPSLGLTALRLMASRVRRHAQLVKALSFHDVGHRLASFLITESQYVGRPTEGRIAFQLVLSNQEIASRIGSVRDVVSRAFARLKEEGLIARKGRSLIIPDLRALRAYAASAGKSGTTRRADGCH
ncbi:MAG TPA: Crp/Fnr family transcriptional regulator [Terriglobales bacterium]|nr:Crp/Fnr family transcriptional regulator [Terriglobales bacterium]